MENNPNQPLMGVSDFLASINQTLEYAYPTISIEGEVSSFKVNQSKYVFFDLKDENSSVGCFMSVWQLKLPIEDGMKVVVVASPKLTAWGKFSLTVRSIRPSGEGAIRKSFEILKAKLDKEGLFEANRKRTLPAIPRRVAVISSTQAAGYADFVKIINDRWGGLAVDVAHVQVQGEVASKQIINAINYFNQQSQSYDVLAIIRGGGSADDLAVFNEEPLVRAIAASRIPTLVGVGHETDESLSDLVADVRAATPSNAAQILVPNKYDAIKHVKSKIDGLIPTINSILISKINNNRQVVLALCDSISRTIDNHIERLRSKQLIITQFDPQKVLERGYALVRGKPEVGKAIEIEMSSVVFKAEVTNVKRK